MTKPITLSRLNAMKAAGEKISCLTAYDASFAQLLDSAGIEVLLVGDSLGMVVQGHSSTVPVTVADMVYHSCQVAKARQRAFVMTDLPFASYASPVQAVSNAARLMQAGAAQMVKLEGAKLEVVRLLVEQGIPVCGHLGLLPQSVNCLGGYSVQGKTAEQAERLIKNALALQDAGASLLILECVPAALAATITQQLAIPVIGIGAGPDCDGQVLVLYDMLGISPGALPRFCHNFMTGADSIAAAVRDYHDSVKAHRFPLPQHSY
jgi:3-methyl-2-oxobutanoate hydroxymethyltransferase